MNNKIAVLHPSITKMWGAVKMMIQLSSLLKKDNELVFFTNKIDNILFKQKIDFDLKEVNFWNKYLSYLIIAYKIRKFDIVFIGNSPMHFVGVLSKILFFSKAKLIWWNHHYPWYYEKKHNSFFVTTKRIFEKLLVKNIDLIIANSNYIKESLENIFKINNIKILYPSLDEVFYKTKFRQEDNKILNIFTYSRWVKWKNIKLIFESFDELFKIYNFNLIIAWEWEELEYFEDKYNNSWNIEFLWNLNSFEIISNLKKSDIFLFPSKIDSFGLVNLEAMFAWLPIIWFDIWWAKELIKNNKNGFLVNSENEFIKKLETLLKDDKLRKKFSKESLMISNTNFNSNVFKKQLDKILEVI